MSKRAKALPLTITLGSILLFFCLILITIWNIIIYNQAQLRLYANKTTTFYWISLIVGSVLFIIIITGVILFMVFLARQIILNQMQNNFIDSVTHEFKTPLTSLKLYIETIKKYENLPKEKKDSFLNIMLKDVDRLNVLVNHVLEASRLDNLNKEIQTDSVFLNDVIQYCTEIILERYHLDNDSIDIEVSPLKINTDQTLLQLVLINLLDNSVKYSDKNIKIHIQTIINKSNVIIIIKDSGIGISKKELKKIFRRFYRVSSKLTEDKKGTGLGLYIVKETVKKLKGKIQVESQGEHKGTTFKITLPMEN